MPSISEKSGVGGVFSYTQEKIFSERPFFDKKYRFRDAQQFGISASVGAPPLRPQVFCYVCFCRSELVVYCFPPSPLSGCWTLRGESSTSSCYCALLWSLIELLHPILLARLCLMKERTSPIATGIALSEDHAKEDD
nr:MAG TPA: hypothetical protein [Caudoviricetes sp.]